MGKGVKMIEEQFEKGKPVIERLRQLKKFEEILSRENSSLEISTSQKTNRGLDVTTIGRYLEDYKFLRLEEVKETVMHFFLMNTKKEIEKQIKILKEI